MTVHIEALTFETIVGILDFERTTPQRVVVDCSFSYDYHDNRFIDYVQVGETIKQTMQEKKFHLLEDALESLFVVLQTNYPSMKQCLLKSTKPDILPDCKVSLSDSRRFDS